MLKKRVRWPAAIAPAVPGLYLAAALCGASAELQAAGPPHHVVRVEEDWELVVQSTDLLATAPQVTTMISPVGHLEDVHAVFEVNHSNVPSFQAGGLHLQTWQGRWVMSSSAFADSSPMSHQDETVCWTQALALGEGVLTVEILQGSSTTWGAFDGGGGLQATIATELTNLNGHDPDVSADNSGVGFAGNRVASLKLVRTRRYLNNGTVIVDQTARDVHLPN